MNLSSQEISVCRALHKMHGKHYYYASMLFPREMRYATHILYAFFRVADEYVDAPNQDPAGAIKQFREAVERLFSGAEIPATLGEEEHIVLGATHKVFQEYNIPERYAFEFLDAMEMDLTVDRYATYKDLEHYMYGSAAVVGLMMSYVIGFKEGALPYAEKLGYAMQLTNFVRDLKEDIEERGRIYLPQNDLKKFSVQETDLYGKGGVSPHLKELLKFEIQKCRDLYRESDAGILLLNKQGQFAVRAASRIYEGILDDIEKHDYDIFSARRGFGKLKKILILIQTRLGL